MLRLAARLFVFALAFGMTISLARVGASAPPPKLEKKEAAPERKPERTPEEIQKLLDEKVKCSYLDMELRAALSDLSQQTGVRIKLDSAFLQQQPGDMEQLTVSLDTPGMPLRKALRKLTETYQMCFGIVGDTVWISTEEGIAARQLRQYISVSCKEQPLSEVVGELAKKYAVNMVLDAKARKTKLADAPITLELSDATLETVLRLSTEMAGLKPVRIGSVIYITSEDRADKLRDGDNLVPSIPLMPERNGDPAVAQPAQGQPMAPGGAVQTAPAVLDVPEKDSK